METAPTAGAVGAAGLAFTGVESWALAALALGLALAGTALIAMGRRRAHA